MAVEYTRQYEIPTISALSFDERLGMITDAEWLSRENNRIKKRLKEANLRFPSADLADIDYRPSRKLDRAYIARLSDFAWVREARNLILTGCTGTGKTWLVCAFGSHACRVGLRVAFYRVNRLLNDMTIAAGAGNIDKLIGQTQ
jgi:DNA replication protein DnaC